jgi:thioredoxin-related protein
MMLRSCVSSLLIPLGLATAVSAQQAAVDGVVRTIDTANREAKYPVAPLSEQATLAQGPGKVAPADAVVDAWSGVLELGKRKFAVVLGKATADAEFPNVLWCDTNGNGKFEAGERSAMEVTKRTGRAAANGNAPEVLMGKPVEVSLQVGSGAIVARATFMRQGEGKPSLNFSFANYLEATVQVGGEDRVVAVQDKDFDGTYGSAGDLWTMAKPGDRPASAYAMSGFGEHRFEAGKNTAIEVAGTKIKVASQDATGPDPKDLAAQRHRAEVIWSDRFDKEREDFVKAREMDVKRPKTTKPIEWRYVTFEQALAMAKAEKKPLFVDVMAFWCVWCYRMDYYTYCDQEVAALMTEKYIPVKILQEQDPAKDYDMLMKKMEARGIPAMGVFDAEGNVVHKIGGWMKPEKFLDELRQGLK